MLYRCLDVVERLHTEGVEVGLINKPTLNIVDEEMMGTLIQSPFVLVVETQNIRSGLGARFGTWLLERASRTRYACMGTFKEGRGGLTDQIPYQGLGAEDIRQKVMDMLSR
jgi:transketolase C-terminal domain/subunit